MTRDPKIYLAGPGVFRPDAAVIGLRLKQECFRHGVEGIWPGDTKTSAENLRQLGLDIMKANFESIRDAHAIVADITPFRGPHCDVGTAVEIGYATALLKPVFGYSEAGTSQQKLHSRIWAEETATGWRDAHGCLVEEFGLHDNLMVAGPLMCVVQNAATAIARAAHYLRGVNAE